MSNLTKQAHLFFYDGTAMEMPSELKYDELLRQMEDMFEAVKKDMVRENQKVTTNNIKTYCNHFLEDMNTKLLSTDGDDITFKKMRLAWGKDAPKNQIYWCAYVWILENKCGVQSTDTFGYFGMVMGENEYNKITLSKDNIKCANCDYCYPSMMKCSACKKERYCSPECQKSHWKIHKKVCCK